MSPAPSHDGFTLVEALTAMTILAVGIVGVLGAYSLSSRSGSEAVRLASAAEVAEEQLQAALGSDGAGLASRGASGPYRWERKTSDLREGLQVASVEVTWTDRTGPRSFGLSEVFLPRESSGD